MFANRNHRPAKAPAGDKPARADVAGGGRHTKERNPIWQTLALDSVRLQPKLTVSQPGDAYEQEADRVADHVMRMAAPASHMDQLSFSRSNSLVVQRKCNQCEEEEEQKVHRKTNEGSPTPAGLGSPSVNQTIHSAGRPLDSASRTFFEPRFGRDFSDVRIHTDTKAAESARSVSALAYTVGRNVVFGAGQYAPNTDGGRRLLAHELSHVCQQANEVLLREEDPYEEPEFDGRAAALKSHKVYKALDWNSKNEIDKILAIARKRKNALQLLGKLEKLIKTPDEDPDKQAAAASQETEEAAEAETERLKTTDDSRKGEEEAVSKERLKYMKPARGLGGTTFLIDARDPTDIAVKVNVRLVRAGQRTEQKEVTRVASLEDAIEKRARTLGYIVDLNFVNRSGADVFTVQVNTEDWTKATNWIGDDMGLAHELHHLLGLKEDRYDYIETHTENKQLKMHERIHWFYKELVKVIDNAPRSIMNIAFFPPLDDDVCMVAGFTKDADKKACVEKRTKAREDKLWPALGKALIRTYKAQQLLLANTLVEARRPGEETMSELKQKWAMVKAEMIFGKPIALEQALKLVKAMRRELVMSNLFLSGELTPNCDKKIAQSAPYAPRILLCPSFLKAGVEEQANALLLEAVRRAGMTIRSEGLPTKDDECPATDCDTACHDETYPAAWVRFINCLQTM